MTSTITTQWGTKARPFSSYSKEELLFLLENCRRLMTEIFEDTGIETFLTYGCLLGAARAGKVIPHDFDIDLGFLVHGSERASVLDTANNLIEYLISKSFKINSESNGQFKASYYDSTYSIDLEFFAAWTDDDKFNHYFAVKDKSIAGAIFPFGVIDLEGIQFIAPKEPEILLEAIYGENWRLPDPSFRYTLTEADWQPFEFLFTNKNRHFWEKYYDNNRENKVWLEVPSQFAAFVAAHTTPGAKLLDFGCGNGRDSVFFSKLGFKVTCADYSQHALDACARSAQYAHVDVDLQLVSIASFAEALEFGNQYNGIFDVVYARFFLHAIDEISEGNLLTLAYAVLQKGGKFVLEYRCTETAAVDRTYENGEHYRRLINQAEFEKRAIETGFLVEYSVEGKGLAKFRSEDPFIGRIVLVK